MEIDKQLDLFEQTKADGYIDIAKQIGTKKSGNSGFQLNLADDKTIASLYVGNGLTKRYIDLLVDDMTRQWIHIPEDTDGLLMKYLKRLNAKTEFKNASRCTKLFGGSIIFMVIDDGKEPNEPVDINNIKSIKKLKYFSRKYITIDSANYYQDLASESYGDPEYFTISKNSLPKVVHESRCLVFNGEYYPRDELSVNTQYEEFWGLSVMQSLHEIFEDYGLALQALLKTLLKFNIDVLKIKNLMMLLSNPDGKKKLQTRVEVFDLAKSVSNTVLLDNDESFESVSQQLQGVADTFNKIQETVAAMSGVPSNILMGTSIKGLNANGNGEMRIYYDKIKSEQIEHYQPQMEKLTSYIKFAKDSKLNPETDYDVEFNSLWQQTDQEIVEMRNKQADTDQKYVDMGVLDPNEVRENRFGNGHYSIETLVEGDAPILPEEPAPVAKK